MLVTLKWFELSLNVGSVQLRTAPVEPWSGSEEMSDGHPETPGGVVSVWYQSICIIISPSVP